jgi:ethanolamine ammonia-lyase small subunit
MSEAPSNIATADPWATLRRHTAARIALGRAGASLPTAEVLRFALDHALARDAVHAELDIEQLEKDMADAAPELSILRVASRVTDRTTYLQRPDLGRQLDDASRQRLSQVKVAGDVSLVLADGLSATATQRHAAALCGLLVPRLRESRLAIGPLVIARFARVALQDEIGQALGARCSVILIGERPGLGTPDSLGAYVVFNPKPGNTDAQRNCVSNIRPAGLPLQAAADTLHFLIAQSLRLQLSGVNLKDDRPPALPSP